jgi:sensor histidine kinase YesM
MRGKRKKVWIDRFQTRLSLRIGLYFILYQVLVWAVAVISRHLTIELEGALGEAAAVPYLAFSILTAVLLSLMFIYDAVRFTHRFVGPLYRFRETLKAVASGEEVALIRLRQGDHLLEMKDEFNEMLKALEQRGAVVLKPQPARQDMKQPVTV